MPSSTDPKFRNVLPGARPTEYEVAVNGVVIGRVKQQISSTIQFGTITYWQPVTPDGRRLNTRPTRAGATELLITAAGDPHAD